jgi:hypothetical protein
MMAETGQDEQSEQKRFRVRDDALVMFKPPDSGIGRLLDISMSGVTFDHITTRAAPFAAGELDILITGTGLRMEAIPCRTIWNLTINEKPEASLYETRFGVQFGELTPVQIRQLEYVIQNHTEREIKV